MGKIVSKRPIKAPNFEGPLEADAGSIGTSELADAGVTRTKMSSAAGEQTVQSTEATIATTGNTDSYVTVPQAGTLAGVDFAGIDALAANDTNYITFSITNLGQDGLGSTAMLAATDANTTKATGGTALAANTKRQLDLHGTPANLVVAAGDRLRIRYAASGTLSGQVTGATALCRFAGTT